jgi:hypothetical protein
MAEIELRVRLIGGDRIDVTYAEPDTAVADVIDHAVATLADDRGVLRTRHGGRLVVLFSRGVTAVEVSPRGAIL